MSQYGYPILFYFYIDDSPVDFSEYVWVLVYIYTHTQEFAPHPPGSSWRTRQGFGKRVPIEAS